MAVVPFQEGPSRRSVFRIWPNQGSFVQVFNATVVPSVPLGYLTLWPDDGSPLPAVATLNAVHAAVTSNMAIGDRAHQQRQD